MNSYSHLHIGTILLHKLQNDYGLKLPKTIFLIGNIRPDFSIKYLKKPHYYQDVYQDVQKMVSELICDHSSRRNLWILADRLGVICHYFCDFFCHAHSQNFEGKFKDHLRYEAGLNHYIKKRRMALKRLSYLENIEFSGDLDDLFKSLNRQYQQYRLFDANFGLDMVCSLQACLEMMVRVLQILLSENQLPKTQTVCFAAES